MKSKNIFTVALVTIVILMVPFIAMQFTNEVSWNVLDFVVAGLLLFGAGLSYALITRKSGNISYRIAVGVAVGAGLLLIWTNLAVGIIGNEGNPANLMYSLVIVVGIIGAFIVRFRSKGMSRTLFVTAFIQAFIPVIALIIWKTDVISDVGSFLAGNLLFVILFVVSAFLFRQASRAEVVNRNSRLEIKIQ